MGGRRLLLLLEMVTGEFVDGIVVEERRRRKNVVVIVGDSYR